MTGTRQFAVIASVSGLATAEVCTADACTHTRDARMVDLRCPESMGKLLGRTQASALPGGVVELACNNCARRYRAAGAQAGSVLHRYNLLGELIAAVLLPA